MGQRISRNASCPCGSGKKDKQCCLRKGIAWEERGDGAIGRVLLRMAEAMLLRKGSDTTDGVV